ncbi:TIGR04141 family sporadically distributed protein [Mesorhizobium sp. CGMCC 1.15528]|uniref:TIGR04141 family sporadically distributed protein n=1 Tax=Mesorhizobium zhangyense TaxID=1776730 RepID=A0A7C9RBT9_9HYPH|nr:DUF6119 family protein [Mesorhizobium zhangyense]NGN45220.1 TIGR04141 family sporadically distributed protein [Mesorhizobium zhangyense]
MSRARPFSIYLLKEEYDATNSLREDHDLDAAEATDLPEGAVLYILDSDPKPPWWRSYFGVTETLLQQFKGALVFLPVGDRWFALSFGQVFHHLNDAAYEYDFGLRVTLNSVDPNELKSADMVAPGVARRKRTQVPVSTELTYLDFDGNSEIIKSLTGRVKKEYEELFRNATGSASLKVSLNLEPGELPGICETLLTLYDAEDYKASFPNIQNISPVNDPSKIAELDELLLSSLKAKDGKATLTIPDIIDYRDNTCCIFQGDGRASHVFPDISIEEFYEFLGDDYNLAGMTIEAFRTFRMMLTDVDGAPGRSYSVYRSLIYDGEPLGEGIVYHLCEGKWYRVEKSYIERLKNYLDAKCVDSDLPPYNHDAEKDGKAVYSEGGYNAAIPHWNNAFICLDQTDISPAGSTEIEPCDIYTVTTDARASCGHRAFLYHLKISTRSSHLSHLFNQGVNSADLIQLETASREKMKALVTGKLNGNDSAIFLAPLDSFDFKVIFGIITHKSKEDRSDNLPLFSKISLMRNMQQLDVRKIPSALMFIEDQSPKKHGHPKHEQIVVEIVAVDNGKTEVRAVDGQGYDIAMPIKSCPKDVRESAVGMRYRLTVKRGEDGALSSYHGWPFEIAV